MEPLRQNTPKNKCGEPVSSNCVVYNGNNIPCIPLCNGDTVSDVEYKLGQQLCYIQSLLNMSTVDLSCIYTPCPSCQNPTTPVGVLQVMVDYMCHLADIITQQNAVIATLGVTPPPNP